MAAGADHEHIIDTGKGTFSLDELGHLMPGMAEIMPLVGARIWKCYYAGQAHNRALARFQLARFPPATHAGRRRARSCGRAATPRCGGVDPT